MAPAPSRQTLLWSLPTLAILLSFFWFKRRRSALRSDPGGTAKGTKLLPSDTKISEEAVGENSQSVPVKDLQTGESFSKFFSKERASLNSKSDSVLEKIIEKQNNSESVSKVTVHSVPQVDITTSVISLPTEESEEASQKLIIVKEDSNIIADEKVKPISDGENQITEHISKEEISAVFETTDSSGLESSGVVVDKISKVESFVKEGEPITCITCAVKDLESVSFSHLSVEQESGETTPEVSLSPCSDSTLRTGEEVSEVAVERAKVSKQGVEFVAPAEESEEESQVSLTEDTEDNEDNSICSVDSFAATIMARKSSVDAGLEQNAPEKETAATKSSSETTEVVESSTASSLVEKLSTLDLGASNDIPCDADSSVGAVASEERHRVERDSANHSPADVMLASPSMSSYSDAQSEGSSDSGKGCSDVATPPSRTPASGSSVSGDLPLPSVYEFVLPQHLVGRLIGRHGCFVHQIKAATHASILIKRHPDTAKLKICAVEGTQMDIDSALEMIRQKFPLKRYPNVTLDQVCFLPPVPTFPLIPEFLQLQLVEGVNNDVILSSLVTPAHFFLQQPTHPTFPALNRLNACMNICYSEPSAPAVPSPVEGGIICAAPTMGGWYRAQVVSVDAENETCDIKFVDYGGYLTIENSVLRQIRSDFMTLPFQAAECYLANVIPVGGVEEGVWSSEAVASMEELTQGQVLQAQVCGYLEDGGMPIVYLYAIHGAQVVPINQELVARGLAELWEQTDA